jgi:hypothetical protein
MPYQIVDEGDGLVLRISGDVSFEEITAANQEGWEHPEWDKHQYQIWDFKKIRTFGVNEEDALLSAYMDNAHTQHTKLIKAAFIADDQTTINILKAYIAGVKSENLEAQIFADETEARKWVSG